MMKKLSAPVLAAMGAALLPALALAQTPESAVAGVETVPTLNAGDTAWMLTSTVLVLFMTLPGIALFYAGMVRKKNVLATLMQSFAICALCSVLWIVLGYSLAFGGGENARYIGDLSNVLLMNVGLESLFGTYPETVWVIFQLTFAVLTPALITGAFAERMKFSALLMFMAAWSLLVYAPICHWVWSEGGFLSGEGVLDFAGGTVVHINSGIAGLVCALMLGRRLGLGSSDMAPHNLVLAVVGASFLWVGWIGFNSGSAGAANFSAGMALVVTQFAAAAAALAWMACEWIVRGKPSVLGIVSGAVAGLVAITPAAGFVGPTGALFIGLAAGVVCFLASTWLKRKLGYDDSLDVFGIHGVGGLVGAVLTGVFAVEAIGGTPGLIEGNPAQVWIQIVGCLATIVWSGLVSALILFVLDKTIGIRVAPDQEIEGLDLALHGERLH
jgi:Amt family ammonium transporter